MRPLAILALALCACDRPAPRPEYFLSQTVECADGTVITRTYAGPVPMEKILDLIPATPNTDAP